jgi:tetraacyldisaccharide 4'-kinase
MTESSIILAPMAALYGKVTETRLALYRRGILKTRKIAAPVISVGNITTGGTGKTPLVEYIARKAAAAGRKVCILTRGYGRENPNQRLLVSDGRTLLAGHREAGDEPRLLAENLLGVAAVVSDADRFAASQWALAELGSEVFILDDGFQHVQLARDLNVATVDATNPWGAKHLLPRGRLRERPLGLARADCIVITRSDQVNDLDVLKMEIEKVSNQRPLFTSRMAVIAIHELASHSDSTTPLPEIPPPVAAFAAIGNQRSFIALLQNKGYEPVVVLEFPDHHKYNQGNIDEIIEKSKRAGAKALITTAKDAVKLRELSFALPCYVLEIEVCIDEDENFSEMIRAAIA